MNLLFWNTRGANKASLRRLRKICKAFSLTCLFLLEPFGDSARMETVRLSLGFDDAVSSNNCKIWAFWRGGVSVSVEENNLQFLHLKITTLASGAASFVTAVYAKCTRRERQQLWTDLCSLQTSVAMAPWLVGGDLNTIASPDEYCGN